MTIPTHIQSSYLFAYMPFVRWKKQFVAYPILVDEIKDHPDYFEAKLTPISNMTDEDARELNYNDAKHFLSEYGEKTWRIIADEADKLRLWGYAVDYAGYSVEQWKESGRLIFKGMKEYILCAANWYKGLPTSPIGGGAVYSITCWCGLFRRILI